MFKQMMIVGMVVGVVVFGSGVVRGTTYYVDVDVVGGDDDGTTWANAYSTINEGVNAASNGDEVWVFMSPRPPRTKGRRRGPIGTLQSANRRLRRKARLEDFIPHDLRRTAATLMAGRCRVT